MGSSPSKPITTFEVAKPLFSESEIAQLATLFKTLSKTDDLSCAYITDVQLKAYFTKIMKTYNMTVISRMAQVFASQYDNIIKFEPNEEFRIRLLFEMLDLKGDDYFDIDEFKQIYPYLLVYQDSESTQVLDVPKDKMESANYLIDAVATSFFNYHAHYISTINSTSTKTKISLKDFTKYVLEEDTFIRVINTWKQLKLF